MKKALFLSALMLSGYASADKPLSQQISQTREAICYNHPNKQLCVDGITNLMISVRAAAEVSEACKGIKSLDDDQRKECDNANLALRSLK